MSENNPVNGSRIGGVIWKIGVVVMSLLALGLLGFFGTYIYKSFTANTAEFNLSPQGNKVDQVGAADVGLGTSVQANVQAAVAEAIAKAKQKLGDQAPRYAYVAFTTGYDPNQVMNELDHQLDSGVKVHGLTSSVGIMTNEGLLKGEKGAIAIMLVAAPDIIMGVSGIDLTKYTVPQEAGRIAIQEAIKDAGKTLKEKPDIIIMNGTPRRNDDMEILDGIAEVVGKDVPVIGGTAGNETNDPTWKQITRKEVFTNGLLLTAVYTKKKIGWSFESGFRLTDKGGIVTKSNGRVLYEIDGRPALDVYSEWLGPEFMQNLTKLDFKEMARYTAHHPLGRIIRGESGQLGYYTLHPVPGPDDLKNKTLSLGGPVPEGSELKLFSSSWQTILSRAESIPAQALVRGGLNTDNALFGIMVICRGAFLALPESEQPKVPMLTNNVVKGLPFIGVISRGEQGPLEGIRNTNANLVESMVIFGK